MANLVDGFLGGFQRAAGYADRNRQVQSQMQMQDMAAAEFNNQQEDRSMTQYAAKMDTAITGLTNTAQRKGIPLVHADGTKKGANDYGLDDFAKVYGKEEAIKIFNRTGFGAGSLGKNKFITDFNIIEGDDGKKQIKVNVGTYDTDEEGKNYVYSERFTGEGKKAADGGEYQDLDLDSANQVFRNYSVGVRRAGGQLAQLGELAPAQIAAADASIRNWGDRNATEKEGKDALNGDSTIVDDQSGDNQGVGITYSPANPSGQTDADGSRPEIENVPMEDKLADFLPQLTTAGGNAYSAIEGGFRLENDPATPAYVDASTIGEYEGYIETNPDVPFNMTQGQFDSLTTEEQEAYKYASRAITYKSIQDRAKLILMPEGSSAREGGLFSSVRNNPMDYKDGKKIAERGMSTSQRQAKDKANKFYADNEGQIYSYLATNPEAFKEFKEDPIAFANNPKYNKKGRLINEEPSSKERVDMLNVGKNIQGTVKGGVTGNPTDEDASAVATVIAKNTNPSNQQVNMAAYSNAARINVSKTVLASIPQDLHNLYAPMLAIFEQTGLMTLDPAKLANTTASIQLQKQYANEASDGVMKKIDKYNELLVGKEGVATEYDLDDLKEGNFAQQLAADMSTAQRPADIHLYSQSVGLMLMKYMENESQEGFINTIKTWFTGGQNGGGFRITPNVRFYDKAGKLTLDRPTLSNGGWIATIGENNQQKGGQITIAKLQNNMDAAAVDLLLNFAEASARANGLSTKV